MVGRPPDRSGKLEEELGRLPFESVRITSGQGESQCEVGTLKVVTFFTEQGGELKAKDQELVQKVTPTSEDMPTPTPRHVPTPTQVSIPTPTPMRLDTHAHTPQTPQTRPGIPTPTPTRMPMPMPR